MRITTQQIEVFISALSKYTFQGELRLHGSRVDDSAKGGDIDLLLLVKDSVDVKVIKSEKYKILVDIKEHIGDQKIDLIISTYDSAQTDPFIQLILPKSQLIHKFN